MKTKCTVDGIPDPSCGYYSKSHSLMSSARIKLLTEYVLLTWQLLLPGSFFILKMATHSQSQALQKVFRVHWGWCAQFVTLINDPFLWQWGRPHCMDVGPAMPGRWTLLDFWFPLKSYLWYLTVHCCWSSPISIYFPLGLDAIYRHLSLLRSTQLPWNSTCWDMNITPHIYSWSICLNKLT